MLISLFLCFLPSRLHIFIRRRLLKQQIGVGCQLKFFTFINAERVDIGKNCQIGPFSFISAKEFDIGRNSAIHKFTRITSRKVLIGAFTNIWGFCYIGGDFSNTSVFKIGDHSGVFSMCYFDCAHGLYIGNNVGTGGYTLIFTHGYWGDFLKGSPRTVGKVVIEDDVWLAWRVFIPPSIKIGQGSLISANSFVTRSVKKYTLMVGNPAKPVSELLTFDIHQENDVPKIKKRAITICKSFIESLENSWSFDIEKDFLNEKIFHIQKEYKLILVTEPNDLKLIDTQSIVFSLLDLNEKDYPPSLALFNYISKRAIFYTKNHFSKLFLDHLRTFGIRLYLD